MKKTITLFVLLFCSLITFGQELQFTPSLIIQNCSVLNRKIKLTPQSSINEIVTVNVTGDNNSFKYNNPSADFSQGEVFVSLPTPNTLPTVYTIKITSNTNGEISNTQTIKVQPTIEAIEKEAVNVGDDFIEVVLKPSSFQDYRTIYYSLFDQNSQVIREQQLSNRFENLESGKYTVKVNDNIGCAGFSTDDYQVNGVLNFTAKPVYSCGSHKIELKITENTTGSNQYAVKVTEDNYLNDYELVSTSDPSVFYIENQFSVGGHNIQLLLIDNSNVNIENQFTIEDKSKLTDVKVTSTFTDGQNNVNVTVTGGTAPFSYELYNKDSNDLITTSNEKIIKNVKPGSYYVKVIDAVGCEIVSDFLSIEKQNLTFAATVNHVCNGDFNIEVGISQEQDNGPFTVELIDQNTSQLLERVELEESQLNYTFLNIVSNSDAFKIKVNSSVSIGEQEVIVPVRVPLTATANVSFTSVSITAQGGQPNYVGQDPSYNYELFEVNEGQSDTLLKSSTISVFDDLNPGTYYVSVVDSNGCKTITENFTVQEPLKIQSIIQSVSGDVSIEVSGGQPPYIYSVLQKNGEQLTFESENNYHQFQINSQDVEFASVVDVNQVSVSENLNLFSINTSQQCGSSKVDLDIVLANSEESNLYQVEVFGNQVSGSLGNFIDGVFQTQIESEVDYTITVFSDVVSISKSVFEASNDITLGVSVTVENTVANQSTGKLIITQPGTGYTFSFKADQDFTDAQDVQFQNLAAGSYFLYVQKDGDCIQELGEFIIIEKEQIITLSSTDYECEKSAYNVLFNVKNVSDFKFKLKRNGEVTIDIQEHNSNELSFPTLQFGDYELFVYDLNDELLAVKTFSLEELSPIDFNVVINNTGIDNNTGSFEINNLDPANKPYTFFLNGEPTGNVIFDLEPNQYDITVKDKNGNCGSGVFEIKKINFDNSVTVESSTIVLNTTNQASVQWYYTTDVTSGQWLKIEGATNAMFKATNEGFYRALITENLAGKSSKIALKTTTEENKSIWTRIIEITKKSLSIDDVNLDNDFKVYPNPTTGTLSFSEGVLGKSYSIYTVLGNKLYSGVFESSTLTIESLPSGIYLLSIEGSHAVKIIKK